MPKLTILRVEKNCLSQYVSKQIANLFPDGYDINTTLEMHLDETLIRLRYCINSVRAWENDIFDPLHSSQYCTFLYFLSNTIWKASGNIEVPTRLFFLNKSLNGIDLFYEVELPPIFYIGHSVGIVLAKATYGNYLVLYQNSTIGKNLGDAPCIEEGVIVYPNSAVIGRSIIRKNTVISQGVSIINQNTEPNSIVYSSQGNKLVFIKQKKKIIDDFFLQ
jgi:serine O-acetyltransferase